MTNQRKAIYARRMKRPDFRAKWDAVLETGRAAVEMHLVEAAKKSFDPDELDVGDEAGAKVSVTEAIRIVQLHGKAPGRTLPPEPEAAHDDIEAVRERIFQKLQRLRKRKIAQGWTCDENGALIPPGWVKALHAPPEPSLHRSADFIARSKMSVSFRAIGGADRWRREWPGEDGTTLTGISGSGSHSGR